MDLEPWSWIVPCGLNVPITSIAEETGTTPDAELFADQIADAWATESGSSIKLLTPDQLAALA